jgi:hypothetical protein
MARKVWKPVINGKAHTIEVKLSAWSGSGELLVDGKIIDSWAGSWSGSGTRHFQVAGKSATLKATAFSYNLLIEGQKVNK